MLRRLVIAGLATMLAAPALLVAPAEAAVLFSCDSVTGSGTLVPGLVHDKRPQSLTSGADITLASTSDTGVPAGGAAGAISADGTRVVFFSGATNLDPGDTDGLRDVYVKDLVTGDLMLASTSDTGVKGNGHTSPGEVAISADGSKVAFASQSTNLDPGDTDVQHDTYVKDLTTGDITLASTSDTGVKGNLSSGFRGVSLSADGTRVAFDSSANLDPGDTDGLRDVYVKDLTTGDITLASTSDTGVKGNADNSPSLSADGTRVAFASDAANLDPGDTDNVKDVYVKDLGTGDITLASTSDTGVKGNDNSSGGKLSADGTRVALLSTATNLDPGDTDSPRDVYVKDLTTGDLMLASTSDTGVKGNSINHYLSLSDDGTKVAFVSQATNLDPADTNGDFDVYVKTLASGDITLASISDTGVKGNGFSFRPTLSADGSRVAFDSGSTNLDAQTPGSGLFVKDLPAVATSIDIDACSNGNSGTASVVDLRSYGSRPLGCPTSLGGAAGNDYADTTPVLVGATLSMTIDWATGPNSYGVAAAKAGPTGTQWRFRLAITASPGHDTPATNQYLPAAGSGFTKTRLQGKLDISALDSFDCTSGVDDPVGWLGLVNNGSWVAKTG
jgi:hypothetical protein